MAEEKIQGNGEEQKKKRKRNHYYRRNKRRNNEVPLSEKNSEEITEVNDIEDASFEAEEDGTSVEKNDAGADPSPAENSGTEEKTSSEDVSSGEASERDDRRKNRARKKNKRRTDGGEGSGTADKSAEEGAVASVGSASEMTEAERSKDDIVDASEQMTEDAVDSGDNGSDNKNEQEEIIGIRFRDTGKIYYFSPGEFKVSSGDSVIVETVRGMELGNVVIPNKMVSVSEIVSPLKSVVRIATDDDKKRVEENKKVEAKAREFFCEKAREHELSMTLVDVEYTFDNSKLLFYFTSEGRVDFRELVKELASVYKTRIELRQIGVRDEAKQIGGLGICGRPFCCKTFLNDFQQVTIKMAKDQNLSLNSTKISGTCGRLMCCLRYENDVYEEEARKTPRVDSIVETPMGRGVVTEANVLLGMVKVVLDKTPEAAPESFHRSKVKVISSKKREDDIPDDLKALEDKN